jgi:hypothetical protein
MLAFSLVDACTRDEPKLPAVGDTSTDTSVDTSDTSAATNRPTEEGVLPNAWSP